MALPKGLNGFREGSPAAGCVQHKNDGPPRQGCKVSGAALVILWGHSIEEAHDAFHNRGSLRGVASERAKDSVETHQVEVERLGWGSRCGSMILRIDKVWPHLKRARVESALGKGGEQGTSGCGFARAAVKR
jgi:hypothetical protein